MYDILQKRNSIVLRDAGMQVWRPSPHHLILPYPIVRLVGSWPKCNATRQGPLRQLSAAALTQIPRHQKVGHLGGDPDTKKRIQSRIQNVPKSTPSWVIVIMMGVCKWNLTSKELPYIPMQWYLIYGIIWHCITLCEVTGPGLLIPKPQTTPSIHRWVYETWLSVAIPELSSTQHLLPEPTKQVCVQNIRNDTRLKLKNEKDVTETIPGWEDWTE